MNVLFLTMGSFESIEEHSIYTDLLRCFRNHGNIVYVINPAEKGDKTCVDFKENSYIVHVKTGGVKGSSNLIKKGIAQVEISSIYIRAIQRYFSDVRFDLLLYSTPPITLVRTIEYVKKRDGVRTYLLLKDIFPQNAVDIGMMSKTGVKGLLYKHFRKQEKKLYAISDRIGCMSQANVDYVIKHNPEVDPKIVEVCPNSIEVIDKSVSEETRKKVRTKYGIPLDKKVFVYGGNLGKPQGIPFLIECLKKCQNIEVAYFLIVGDGTEYGVLENYMETEKPKNVKLMKRLPKEDYDTMVGACDVGLIFLDHRFTIPNFPSRLLSYMQAKIPVLACTDPNTDIGDVIESGGFGWWCESDDVGGFKEKISDLSTESFNGKGDIAFDHLSSNYSAETSYHIIMQAFKA